MLTVKNDLKRLSLKDFGTNNVVVLECNITRWRCDDTGKSIWRGLWKTWRAGFDVIHVDLLHVSPPPAAIKTPLTPADAVKLKL